uniref:Replication factor C subunit 2 n=1 Tax=Arundo donax TaxID=35708 RepID=A0A0A9EZ40_ARUDO
MGGEIPSEAGEGCGAPGGGDSGAHQHPPDRRPAAHAVLWPSRHGEDHHSPRHCPPALWSRAVQVKSFRA